LIYLKIVGATFEIWGALPALLPLATRLVDAQINTGVKTKQQYARYSLMKTISSVKSLAMQGLQFEGSGKLSGGSCPGGCSPDTLERLNKALQGSKCQCIRHVAVSSDGEIRIGTPSLRRVFQHNLQASKEINLRIGPLTNIHAQKDKNAQVRH